MTHAVPRWFTPVVVVALLWNLIGLAAIVSDIRGAMAAGEAAAAARPLWSVMASVVAVVGGTLGCLALLLRSRLATRLFVASLAGLVLQDAGLVLAARGAANPAVIVLQGLVFAIAVALLWLARRADRAGWLSSAPSAVETR